LIAAERGQHVTAKIAVAAAALGALVSAPLASADLNQYLSNPGFAQSTSETACAGAGAFQFFEGQPGYLKGGADGYQTGLNNAVLCGNRQGNLP
jgi:hypothetical protein